MTCEQAREAVAAGLEDGAAHLAACADCRRECDELARARDLFRPAPLALTDAEFYYG